jgi:UDP:flavonoid glycosyltransferase YjiC (YdhE family)
MPLIWAAISAHGYGHAAQVVPVLNALTRLVPQARALLRTTVPASFFADRLLMPWELSSVQQDVGCIQDGPLTIDVEATWREHDRFHAHWMERVKAEAQTMRTLRPDMVLADTPYLALAAAQAAGVPSVALASFTWDIILSEFGASPAIPKDALLADIRASYARADLALRITPSPAMDQFRRTADIGPIAEPAAPARRELASRLALAPGERTVLVGFGGIQLAALPFDALDRLTGYRFLFDGAIPNGSRNFVSTRTLPFSFKTLMASVDVIVTKPGYATLVEAVALQVPLVYVRRYNFADEQPLVEYLGRHGRGVELSREDFFEARWEAALRKALELPAPTAPPPAATGAADAAARLASDF